MKCHYCRGECEILNSGCFIGRIHWSKCTKCSAMGLVCDSNEDVKDAHDSVCRVPEWSDVPQYTGENLSFCQDEHGAVGFVAIYKDRVILSPNLGHVVGYAAYPLPRGPWPIERLIRDAK